MNGRGERQPGSGRLTIAIVGGLLLAALLFSSFAEPTRRSLRLGEPSPRTFTAPVDLQVDDRLATEVLRQAIRAQVPDIATVDVERREVVLAWLAASDLPESVRRSIRSRYQEAAGVRAEEVGPLIAVATALLPAEERAIAQGALRASLVASALPDPALSEAVRSAAAAAVAPVTRALAAGEVVLREGETVTAEVLGTLTAAGLYDPRNERLSSAIVVALGAMGLAVLAMTALGLALAYLAPRLSPRQVSALVGLTLAVLIGQRFAFELATTLVIALLVPLLVAVLISEAAGVAWAVWMAVVTAIMAPSAPMLTLLAALVAGVVAVRAARNVRARVAVVLAGVAGGLAGGAAMTAWVALGGGLSWWATAASLGIFVAGGTLAGVLALGLLPLFESGAGFLTDFALLELSSPNHPLLQRLLVEAPGSYQHSLIISNMVEPAVAAIGGNARLARVGALYHDVGKMRRPQFFTENQFGGENPHDRISPHLSYLIITSHVRDGLELLREYGMPQELDPFVAEHHGTLVLAYFYKRALADAPTVSDLNFRYPGPRPRSKETAVLLLADAVEAASRTLAEPTQGSIRALIDRLIEQRLQDGQLSESPLNLRELEVIAATFERMLTAVLHRRVAYPSAEEIRGLRRAHRNPGRDRSLPLS
jgi:cyclic-di-AMP phosphodiesterase PgpH